MDFERSLVGPAFEGQKAAGVGLIPQAGYELGNPVRFEIFLRTGPTESEARPRFQRSATSSAIAK